MGNNMMNPTYSSEYDIEIPSFGGTKTGAAMCKACLAGLSGGVTPEGINFQNTAKGSSTDEKHVR